MSLRDLYAGMYVYIFIYLLLFTINKNYYYLFNSIHFNCLLLFLFHPLYLSLSFSLPISFSLFSFYHSVYLCLCVYLHWIEEKYTYRVLFFKIIKWSFFFRDSHKRDVTVYLKQLLILIYVFIQCFFGKKYIYNKLYR